MLNHFARRASFILAILLSFTTVVGQMIPFSFWKAAGPIEKPTAVVYSLRKVVGSYSGPLIRVRRSNDNAEQDIGYDGGGNLDTSALTTFVGANSGFVRTWYDQSGNARHATQTTAGSQPRIVNAGVVDTLNSKPTVTMLGSQWMSVPRPVQDDWTLVSAVSATHTTANANVWDAPAILGGETSGNVNDATIGGVVSGVWMGWTGNTSAAPTGIYSNYIHANNGKMFIGVQRRTRTSGLIEFWVNGVSSGSGTGSTTTSNAMANMGLGAAYANGGGNKWTGTLSEIILYPSVLSSTEREAVEQELATLYGVTWQTSWPTTGSTIFSVRRVNPSYTGPLLRVRRSNDNAELDIGFDGSGNLDTAALSAFVTTNSAFVRTWYDQSGNLYHATQTTAGSQPRIVNAGVTETMGGRPTVRFLGSQWMSVRRVAVFDWSLISTFSATHTTGGAWFTSPSILAGDLSGVSNDVNMGGLGSGRWLTGIRDNTSVVNGTSPNINAGFNRVGSQRRTQSSGLVELWVSGATEGSATISTSAHLAMITMAVGGKSADGADNKWIGTMSEVLVYDRIINNTDREAQELSQATYFNAPLATAGSICDSGDYSTVCVINTQKLFTGSNITGTGILSVRNGGSISAIGTSSLTLDFATTEIQSGGIIEGNVTIIGGNLDIQSGGILRADRRGFSGNYYAAGNGPGAGAVGAYSNGAGGGGHGGAGQSGGSSAGGTTYGSAVNPTTWGSSGGGGDTAGGTGGGAIRINVTGNVNIAGTLSADGGDSASNPGCCQVTGGGGAGGSIWITSSTISGTGLLSAKGGRGGTITSTTGAFIGSGGGGGRIAVESDKPFGGTVDIATADLYDGTYSMKRGFPGTYSATFTSLCDSGNLSTTCTISSVKNLHSGYAISGTGNLVIASGGALKAVSGNQEMSIAMSGDVTIQNGGLIEANLTSFTATNVDIQTGGIVRADSKGHFGTMYAAGSGTGGGAVGYYNNGGNTAGGGHGGAGATVGTSVGGTTYGSLTNPTTWGSAGGGYATAGGFGGGAIRINVTGNLNVAGTLSARGGDSQTGITGCCMGTGGGGAGGSIWITSNTISGAGTISVQGGVGGDVGNVSYVQRGGGGGGGRIAIESSTFYPGVINISGGDDPAENDQPPVPGAPGTYYSTTSGNICDSGTTSTTCTISAPKNIPSGYALTGTGNLIIASGGILRPVSPNGEMSISFSGDVTVQSGGLIDINLTNLAANNIDVQSGGVIRADSRGFLGQKYAAGAGSGGGSIGTYNSGAGGGGHGGAGASQGTSPGGGSYGSATNPVTWGSAGGGRDSAGGNGGGALRINATSNLNIGGTISVNGGSSANAPTSCCGRVSGGGGAGGSIWITAGTLTGTGTLSATGGTSGTSPDVRGAGGGGGRIAIESNTLFSGTLNIAGGDLQDTTSAAPRGTRGTYYATVSGNLCDSGSLATTCTISTLKNVPDGFALSGTGNLVVASGGQLRVQGSNQEMSISLSGDLTVQSGGVIDGNIASLTANNVDIQSGGVIRADSRGFDGRKYAAGLGSGAGAAGAYNSGAGGGGHGGAGAGGGTSAGGGTYGSLSNPVAWGSSGGGYDSAGGNGGGALRINVTGNLNVSGTLSALGETSAATPTACCGRVSGGGGAGGSIWVTAGSISGAGTISVAGAASGVARDVYGSGGGGGRISIESNTLFAGTVNVQGGDLLTTSATIAYGLPGTYYATVSGNICDSGDLNTTCTISTAKNVPTGFAFNGSGNLVIASGGVLRAVGGNQEMSFNLNGDVTVQSGGIIEGNITNLLATNMDIQSGGIVRADADGFLSNKYAAGNGPGGGAVGAYNSGAGGGGYGGAGATSGTSAGGIAYGLAAGPKLWGSAGGGFHSAGGAGGGAIRINLTGTMTVNGSLTSNGGNSANAPTACCGRVSGGGGSGGSIWITAGTLQGAGTITANGGTSGTSPDRRGGGGGGGRIAYNVATDTFSGTETVAGGTGSATGSVGTISNGAQYTPSIQSVEYNLTGTELEINFEPVVGALSYKLYWATSSGVTTSSNEITGITSSPYILTGLSKTTTYYVRMLTVTAGGDSALSEEFSMMPGDLYGANVTLLMRGEGTNGSATFTDSSSYAHTFTRTGNTQVSTSQYKFGSGSLYNPGGSYRNNLLTSPVSTAAFELPGDFTVEAWVYMIDRNTCCNAFMSRSGGDNSSGGMMMSAANGNWSVHLYDTTWRLVNGAALPTGTWVHFAITRSSNVVRYYINGAVQANTYTTSMTFYTNGQIELFAGHHTDTNWNDWNGYMDELRITKGVARYGASSFSPPTKYYPAP